MKRVRFEAVKKVQMFEMNDSECHSPRPFIEREVRSSPPELPYYDSSRVLPYQTDPIQRYETSNTSPYPMVSRTQIPSFNDKEPVVKPSDDLDLSVLDESCYEPRKPMFCKSILKDTDMNKMGMCMPSNVTEDGHKLLSSVENKSTPPNVLVKDNSFFIRRDNLDKYFNVNPLQSQFNKLSMGKENDPVAHKAEMMITGSQPNNNCEPPAKTFANNYMIEDRCKCHHCDRPAMTHPNRIQKENQICHERNMQHNPNCACSTPRVEICPPIQKVCKCSCNETQLNAIEQKTLAIEKYEKSKHPECMEIEKQTNLTKEKREPTVADLFKIIKLQNEQLQLLQEKVDKFIISSHTPQPTITCSEQHVASVQNDSHKMSVGVMTSFEMIRTSTVINKEFVKHSNENSQIHCNKSQISFKGVVSNPVNMNILEGIAPKNPQVKDVIGQQTENVCEEKTLNELSLYNVQVDNATTPLMSPEQTMYLDVRDYSDSEASHNDHSNVGWTYYNKVMTHVNGMLQDSEMPSSASALYRNMRQQCVQMQIDKTNVSVTKRVKFGDDPLGLHQPHIYAPPATETSLKMNQLAAKYLKQVPQQPLPRHNPAPAQVDMSLATRNYMEKHRILQGFPTVSKPQQGEMPRFLDITALKQQPKFL